MFTILFILFAGLKLGGVISWSWWAVCCPFTVLGVAMAIKIHMEEFGAD